MAKQKRSSSGGVDWLPCSAYRVAMNATASDAQVTILDQVIENVSNSQDYSSGAVVGLRAWLTHYPGVAATTSAEFVALLLPSGMAVPACITPANKKANERFIWFQGLLEPNGTSSVTMVESKAVEIRSSRKFDQGDRLVIVFINRNGAATAAGGLGSACVDVYVREA